MNAFCASLEQVKTLFEKVSRDYHIFKLCVKHKCCKACGLHQWRIQIYFLDEARKN